VGRERNPNRRKAFEMWKESGGTLSLKDIAAALGVADGTVRGWKNKDNWEERLNGTFQSEKRSAPKNAERSKRKGAPLGNKNAAGNSSGAPPGNKRAVGNSGGGAPSGNKNAVTTGEYESLMLDMLDEEERERFSAIPTDPLVQIDLKIRELSWREWKMMQRIKQKESGLTEKQRRVLQEMRKVKDAVTVHDEKTGQMKVVPVQREELMTTEIEETEFRVLDDILNIEEALTRVTDKLLKAIKQKHDMLQSDHRRYLEEERLALEKARTYGNDEDEEFEDDGLMDQLKNTAGVWEDYDSSK
jgi:uncharacterized protein YjcR